MLDVDGLDPAADRLAEEGKTPMFVVADGGGRRVIGVADVLKPDSEPPSRACRPSASRST